jgi:hypothetical protein
MSPTCEKCRFFHPWEPDQTSIRGGLMGNCQARPPQLIEQRLGQGNTRLMTKFAAVSSTDPSCGAFELSPAFAVALEKLPVTASRSALHSFAEWLCNRKS